MIADSAVGPRSPVPAGSGWPARRASGGRGDTSCRRPRTGSGGPVRPRAPRGGTYLPGVLHAASRPCSRIPSSVRDTSVRLARTVPGHPEARLSGFRRFLDPAVGRPGPPVSPERASLPTLAPSLPICRPAQDTPPVPSSGRPSSPGRGRRIHPAIRGILRVAPVAAARIRHHLPRVSPHISAAVSWPSRESMPWTDTATGLLNGIAETSVSGVLSASASRPTGYGPSSGQRRRTPATPAGETSGRSWPSTPTRSSWSPGSWVRGALGARMCSWRTWHLGWREAHPAHHGRPRYLHPRSPEGIRLPGGPRAGREGFRQARVRGGPALLGNRAEGGYGRRMIGDPEMYRASTAIAERSNLTLRTTVRRFTRLTNAFSRKAGNHARGVSTVFMSYNFSTRTGRRRRGRRGNGRLPRWRPGWRIGRGRCRM